ncbi:MAG: hypothetical protein V3W14_11675, partial [Candidatus Neomarinimicrobiota bacterium]
KSGALSAIEVDEAGETLIYFTPSANLINGIQWHLGSSQGTRISKFKRLRKEEPEIGFNLGSFLVQQWSPVLGEAEQRLAFDYYTAPALTGQMITSLKEYN